MKAKPILYEGINFRSKLEARWYIFMKKLGWNIIYEPEIEGINGWIPDFLIIGKKKILVDVKPIDKYEEWEDHPDRPKIENSGVVNLNYEILILGTNLELNGDGKMGILYPIDFFYPEGRSDDLATGELGELIEKPIMNYALAFPVFNKNNKKYGFLDQNGSWNKGCRITGADRIALRDEDKLYINTCWNEAWSKLQWKGKEVV